VVSVITGTSWGTIGTIGVALMGIAVGLGINPALTAGAIVAGSYFGDKLSLFSDTTNLAPAAARTNIYDHVGHMLWTTSPAFLIGIVVYLIAGHTESSNATAPAMEALAESLTEQFNITGAYAVLLLIPPVITLGAALLKKPVIPTMLLSCAVAWLLAVTLQTGAPIPHPYITDDRTTAAEAVTFAGALGDAQWAVARDRAQLQMWDWAHPLWAMVRGYELRTENSDLNSLLSRGGMLSMMDTLLIALTAFAFAGIMSITRMLETLLDALLKLATTTGKLVMSTSLSCVLVALCTGSSYLSILLPGELFQKAYSARGLAAKNLSRTTEDCGTVIVPLIPWSVSGAYISGILGVSVVSYAPWAFMCYLGFVFAVLYGFTGFKIAPKIKEDETAPGS
jgi:NhaC family Na+:H+ antiporter